ncbi:MULTISPECIES: hypothetical protein [unclassified Lysobacter]
MSSLIPPWHPWFAESAIVLRRRLASVWVPVALIGLGLGFATALGAGWSRANDTSFAAASQSLLTPLLNWPLLCASIVGIGSYVLVNMRLQAVAAQLRDGWWAAMPIDPRSRVITLCIVAGTVTAFYLLALALAVGALSALGAHGDIGFVSCSAALAAIVGAAAALVVVLRRPRAAIAGFVHVHVRTRRAFFNTEWLQDRQLPHLSDWQRREVRLRWRTGASAMPVCAALLLLPVGGSPLVLLGLLVFALSATWLGLVLRASVRIAASAGTLLRATPAGPSRQRRATRRYPLFACACASTCGVLVSGAAHSWALLVGWSVLVVLVAIPALPAAWRLFLDSRIHTR